MKQSGLKRKTPLARVAAPRTDRSSPSHHGQRTGATARKGRQSRFYDDHRRCRNCPRAAVHQHHVTYAQHVERAGGDTGDPDNALALCLVCHGQQHKTKPLPLSALRDENIRFCYALLGPAAYDYLKARYSGEDERVRLA
jgi:hypothetical protein